MKFTVVVMIFALCALVGCQRYQRSFGSGEKGYGSYPPHLYNGGILRSTNNNDGYGSYSFGFDTVNGIQRDERGFQTSPYSSAVVGSYSYPSPDGTFVKVEYTADENGYRAKTHSHH